MEDDPDQTTGTPAPDSLMPYDLWTEQAMRHVVVQAVKHAAREGLPGGHHFYITFRTDHPRTVIPPRLKAQYPQEMTIVLQHQFWDLMVAEDVGLISVGLAFGGVPSTLQIPLEALTAFADPHARVGIRFRYDAPEAPEEPAAEAVPAAPDAPASAAPDAAAAGEPSQVVSLDAFRRRPPPRDT